MGYGWGLITSLGALWGERNALCISPLLWRAIHQTPAIAYFSMAIGPTPSDVFTRAVEEGGRRLDQSFLALITNGFIAGFTIVFGIIVLGMVQAGIEPLSQGLARIVGAAGFGIGLVFLIMGRAELVTENFFDPVAAVVGRDRAGDMNRLLRLWGWTFVFNLVGGTLLVGVLCVKGVLPEGTGEVLITLAEDIARRGHVASFFKAVTGGVLVTLFSFLVRAVNRVGTRIWLALMVGFALALGPFDHVIVTDLHLLFGVVLGGEVGVGSLVWTTVVATGGNLVGGLGFVTLTHVEQARAEGQ